MTALHTAIEEELNKWIQVEEVTLSMSQVKGLIEACENIAQQTAEHLKVERMDEWTQNDELVHSVAEYNSAVDAQQAKMNEYFGLSGKEKEVWEYLQ